MPHWQQKRTPTGTETRCIRGQGSALHAQIRAIIHPITVHPRNKFNKKIPPASRLSRPMTVGRKYSKIRNSRVSMTHPRRGAHSCLYAIGYASLGQNVSGAEMCPSQIIPMRSMEFPFHSSAPGLRPLSSSVSFYEGPRIVSRVPVISLCTRCLDARQGGGAEQQTGVNIWRGI